MPKGVEHYAAVRSDLIFTVIISVMPKGVEHMKRFALALLLAARDHLCDAERR